MIYLLGMGFGLQAFLDGNRNTFARLSMFLGILGTGLFTYYQGRSHDYNLLSVCWPAVLLGFLFADRLLLAIRARLLPRQLCWLALPAVYFGLMTAVMMPSCLVHLWSFGSAQWAGAMRPRSPGSQDSMDARVALSAPAFKGKTMSA